MSMHRCMSRLARCTTGLQSISGQRLVKETEDRGIAQYDQMQFRNLASNANVLVERSSTACFCNCWPSALCRPHCFRANTQLQEKQIELERTTARHEFGHAVMFWILKDMFPAVSVSGANGFCHQTGSGLTAKEDLWYTLGGLAAEEEFYASSLNLRQSSTGDLAHARKLILDCWGELSGMDTGLTEDRIHGILYEEFRDVCETLWSYRELIDHLVEEIIEKRELQPMIESVSLSSEEALRIAGVQTNWCVPDGG